MPISKNGIPYYTEEQYKIAKEASALAYAKAQGYALEAHGSSGMRMKDHDSMVFTNDGRWHWNSQNQHGGAIDFMMQYENRSHVEAVLILNGESPGGDTPVRPPAAYRKTEEQPKEKQPFVLPTKAGSYKRLFAYLCGTRGLERSVVQGLIRDNRLYLSEKQFPRADGSMQTVNNAVFVSFDENTGKPVGAFERGVVTGSTYRRDVPGSDKSYGFLIPGKDAHMVCVFEATIDAASHASLFEMNEAGSSRLMHHLALGGCSNHKPLFRFLEQNPEVKTVSLCFDNDAAGQEGVKKLAEKLKAQGYTQENGYRLLRAAPQGKDFNEHLLRHKANLAQQQCLARDDPEPDLEMELGA